MRRAALLLSLPIAIHTSCGDKAPLGIRGEISMCAAVGAAMEQGDVDWLTELNIPATMDPGLLAGEVDTRLCASDDLTGEYVMAVGRTTGQVVIIRNTNRRLLDNEPAPFTQAIDTIGNDHGVRLVKGDSVLRLRGTKPGLPADPIGAVLE